MSLPKGVIVVGPVSTLHSEILTPEALSFLAALHRTFDATRRENLTRRELVQQKLDRGYLLDFLPETKNIRDDSTWTGPKPMPGLTDRRVEITGPVDRKMVINALNSGASTFMADFEDANAPTWTNNLDGQINLRDAVRRQIDFVDPKSGKEYKLNDNIATLIVRARGWHLLESNIQIDGLPLSGSLFDFGLFFFHNAKKQLERGLGPYFYLPKMEHYLEARLWNDVFRFSQDYINIPRGSIRATCLIETITAAFQMDEFIFELKEHSAGLNCGRWDYIFSFIKRFRLNKKFILPDRSDVTMTVPFMSAYVQLLIKTCHRRGVAAMGGMSAQIPIKGDLVANEAAMAKVRGDKLREVKAGHDGTWVAHPALVKIAKDIFDEHMVGPNQYHIRHSEVNIKASDLLNTSFPGQITTNGVRANVAALLSYCSAWLSGIGCVPIDNLMEDAATAEIARAQLWSWAHHGVSTKQGEKITPKYIDSIIKEEVVIAKKSAAFGSTVDSAATYLSSQVKAKLLSEFLTSDLYPNIASSGGKQTRL